MNYFTEACGKLADLVAIFIWYKLDLHWQKLELGLAETLVRVAGVPSVC